MVTLKRGEVEAVVRNDLEIRVFGLMRSGNHAVIEWVMSQFEGERICFLNNLHHGDRDPYVDYGRFFAFGFESGMEIEAIRESRKKLLLYSFEDRATEEELQDEERDARMLDRVFLPAFEANRLDRLGESGRRIDLLVIRDPFNCLASRLRLIDTKGRLGGEIRLDLVAANWLDLAELAIEGQPRSDAELLVVSYNRWRKDEAYRREIAERLGGVRVDTSLGKMSRFGGGSSFDRERISLEGLIRRIPKLANPGNWSKIGRVLRALRAPDTGGIQTQSRWEHYREDPRFRAAFMDPRMLERSESLFGEIPGTREFVSILRSEGV